MKFEDYLKTKKIDPKAFQSTQSEQYSEWQGIFDQVHPDSFTQQKLFLINTTRRAFPLKEEIEEKKPSAGKAMRPKIPLKPKTS